MAENRFIRKAIHEAILENPAIQYITASEVESFSDAGASVTAHVKGDGDIAAQLLVAADGRSSGLRAASGIQHKEIRYGQIALVCVVEHSEEHAGIALEKFVPAGPFAVLPMVGRMSGVVWTVEEKFAADYMALSDADFLRELNKLFAGYLGEIKLVSRLWGYPLSLLHAAEYWKGRLALVGDAAHGVHPIAGQGANLGLRDAAVLADLLGKQFSLGLDLGSSTLLERYNQWRRFDVFSMMAATDGLNRLFSNDFPPLKLARNIGLAAVNRVPPLKNVFMKQAMGLMGKLPKAMQG
jgi:2-octaprenyl-6-methoxyphenol hydroxylase